MDNRLKHMLDRIRARQISLNPPLAEPDIRAFERRHKVELPSGYREFLRHVGDGGSECGPCGVELFRLGSYPASKVPKPETPTSPTLAGRFRLRKRKFGKAIATPRSITTISLDYIMEIFAWPIADALCAIT